MVADYTLQKAVLKNELSKIIEGRLKQENNWYLKFLSVFLECSFKFSVAV